MAKNYHPAKATQPEFIDHVVRITGAGAANPTKNFGDGLAVTWISTGLYELTWGESPGTFLGILPGFQATTASQLAGYTVTAGDYDASTRKLRVSVTNGSNALADLTSTQKLMLSVRFKEAGSEV